MRNQPWIGQGGRGNQSIPCRLTGLKAALCLLTLVVGAGAIQGQTARGIDPQELWALVIGVSNYAHAEPLQFAASDALAFSEFLQSPRGGSIPKDHTITLTEDQATRTSVVLALDSIQEKVQSGHSVFIYIAGHGYIRQRSGYFIPSDGDLRSAAASGVNFAQLKDMIESGLAQTRHRILITDICNAGRIGARQTPKAAKIENLINEELLNLQGGGGRFLNLLASRPSEASYESEDLGHGVFTHALLEALNGKAANPGDTVVEAEMLVSYVRAEVPKYTANQQHPMVNDDFDPRLPLSHLNKPGPPPKASAGGAVLQITGTDKTDYVRVQWVDPRSVSIAVRQIPRDRNMIQIDSLQPGEIELTLFDSRNEPHRLKVKLSAGTNTLDLAATKLNWRRSPSQPVGYVASLLPLLPFRPNGSPLFTAPAAEAGEADLLMRLDSATRVYVDGTYFGDSEGAGRFFQLKGLAPGQHILRLVLSPEREQRLRLKLFAGQQILDPPTGELRFVLDVQDPAAGIPPPADLPASQQELLRRFGRALWEDRLVEPSGDSAWDYYLLLRGTLPPALLDVVKARLIIAMGNRAQRTTLKYLRGGDIRWQAAVFDEGATLIDRVRQLFKTTRTFESQQSFFSGRALIEKGQYAQATQELQRSVDLDPEAGHAYNALGLAYWKQNLMERAIPALQQAIALSPQWTYPRNTLALIHLEQRRYADAEQAFQASIQIDREDSTAFHGLGQLYWLLGRFQEAERQIQQAIDFNPGNAYAYETLGRLRQSQQRYAEAEEAFRLAIRLEPDEPSFHASLADLLRQLGRGQDAEQIFARIAGQNQDNIQVVRPYTRLLRDQKRFADAEKILLQATKLAPRDGNLRVLYAEFLREQDRGRDAEQQLKSAIQISPSNAYAHHDLAVLYLIQKKVAEADGELALAIRADPRLPAPHKLLGQIRSAQKRYSDALNEFRTSLALAIDPNQKQEIMELIAAAETSLVRDQIERARKAAEAGRNAQAWAIYAATLKSAPGSRELRDAILQHCNLHASGADISLLPPCPLSDALKTRFWKACQEAESIWQKGQRRQALQMFFQVLGTLDSAELRAMASTPFNLGNDSHGIHQIVYRWALRSIEERDYTGALDLIGSAMQRNLFAAVPNYQPCTIDSLMIRPELPDPKSMLDYDIAHHPDRRAHEVYAAASAGCGKIEEARKYLPAIEPDRPDLATRLLIAKVLQRESRWSEAILLLREGLREPKLLPQPALLAEAYARLAEIQCLAGDCAVAQDTLQEGLRNLPGNKLIESVLKKIKR